jgi:hypothetical protein
MDKDEYYADLSIQSDTLTSEEITSILGMSGDRTWVKGSLIPPGNASRYPHHGWVIRTSSSEEDVEEHVNSLLERLETVKNKVRQISEQADVLLGCVMKRTYCNPSLILGTKVLAAIADMGAGLWVDVYVFPEDAP